MINSLIAIQKGTTEFSKSKIRRNFKLCLLVIVKKQSGQTEPLSQHLLFLEAARWRPLRNKLSPAFTSGKLKEMFYLMCECANHLEEYLDKLPDNNVVELRELTARFTTDVIGNCAFGIEMNALKDEDSEFRKMGRKIFSPSWLDFIRVQTRNLFPKLYDKLAFLIAETELTNFFIKCIVDTMEYRKKNNIVRHDFVNILMELRDNPDKLDNEIEMTYSLCAAQAFVFFAAGFETSSTTMSSALYELAQHQDVQDRLREEIHEELAKNDGILKYESIKRMKYLHAVFLETLRKHPSALLIFRQNVQPYTFQGTKITIPPKTTIIIPTFAIHHDPEIYPNPNLFDPERFIKDSELANSYNYLAFGKGPRNCIGERFAVCQTKVGLITFLRKYRVEVCEKTQIPYVINPAQFLLAPVGGIHLRFKRI